MFEEVLFPVKKQPILYNGQKTGKSMIIREDKDKFISVVSDDYLLIPNRLVINNILKDLHPVLDKGHVKTFSNSRYCSVSFRMNYPKLEVKKGDFVGAVLKVENSYDTTKSLTVSMDALRLVCTNGMTVGSKLYQSSTRHIGNVNADDIVNEMVSEVLENGEQKFYGINDTFREMSDRKITKDMKDKFIKSLANQPQYVTDKIIDHIISDKPKSLWELYNCVTYVTTHEMDRSKMSTLNTEDELNKNVLALLN